MAKAEQPTSPRIAALTSALERGDRDALDAFWREVEREGTPLVEPITDDDARSHPGAE